MLRALEHICGRLSERRASLFLGAGINAGIRAPDGTSFPFGEDLARMICRDLLGDAELVLTLDEAAEYARFKIGAPEFNKYLFDLFCRFQPGRCHLLLTKLPWDTIYTTNYDLLLENACNANPGLLGRLQTITSIETDLTSFSEDDTLYYKLHGSVEQANTSAGRLILTKEDYRTYEQLRQPLFRRLGTDIHSRSFVFVGYSLGDPNFRSILEDCRTALDAGVLPLSYAVRPGHRPAEAAYWKDKYNVQLLDCTAEQFLEDLSSTWEGDSYVITPLEDRALYELVAADEVTAFPKVADCYYRVLPDRCTGASAPAAFFQGSEATWADIRDEVAPPRDAMWDILEAMFDELADPRLPASAYLMSGHAGTGKTCALRTLALLVARDFDIPVVIHIAGTPLEVEHLRPLSESNSGKRVLVVVHNGAELCEDLSRFHSAARKEKLPVTLLIEERTNQWETAILRCHSRFSPEVFELGTLSSAEIERILDALADHGALGVLETSDRATQIEHFTEVAHKDLLVALREITSGSNFDRIVVDEFDRIPSELAKEAYKYVAAVGQVDLFIRYNTLEHLLGCGYQQLADAVFTQTEGVLLSSEFVGRSRHTIGYKLRVRHPVIASIVFEAAAPTDKSKYDVLSFVIESLDPGYPEDRSLLNELVRRRELVQIFAHPDYKRAIYDRLAEALPNNAYVAQHRSILERELEDGAAAVRFAREAVQLKPGNWAIRNTLGFALESASRKEPESSTKKAMVMEATSLFQAEASSAQSSGFGYLGLAQVKRQEYETEKDDDKKRALQFEALALLETAREEIDRPEIVEGEYARLKGELGDRDEAIAVLRSALAANPSSARVRDLFVKFLTEAEKYDEALQVTRAGLKFAPADWRLYRHAARLLDRQNAPIGAVRENYDAAIRHNRGSIDLVVELGAFLFRRSEYDDAKTCFRQADDLAKTSTDKNRVRCWWLDESGKKRVFSGKVSRISGAIANAQAIPENFEAFFWRPYGIHADLALGDAVEFHVGFNTRGPRAEVFRRKA